MTDEELKVFLDEVSSQELLAYTEYMEQSIEDYFQDSLEMFLTEDLDVEIEEDY